MAHFAEIDKQGKVLRVIVINNQDILDNGAESEAKGVALCKKLCGKNTEWVQTSYNNKIRKRYAGVGYTYDKTKNIFIAPRPYPSWTLDAAGDWQAPVSKPPDKYVEWNEATQAWVEITR